MTAADAVNYLGWLPLTRRMSTSLAAAVAIARRAEHDEASVEHLLAALLEDVDATVFFAKRDVDLEPLRAFCRDKLGEAALAVDAAAPAADPGDRAQDYFGGAGGDPVYRANDGAGIGDAGPSFDRADRLASGYNAPPSRPSGASYFGGADYGRAGYGAERPDPQGRAHGQMRSPAPAPKPARAVAPSSALRKVMARASDLAETAGRTEVASETAIRAIAADPKTETGRLLRSFLPAADLAGRRAALPAAAQTPKTERQAEAQPRQEPAFEVVLARADALLDLLRGELQKDRRYRIANDLAAFVSDREPSDLYSEDGVNLGESALPILRATRDELLQDCQFRAYEKVRASLRTIRFEQDQLRGALRRMAAEGRLSEGGALMRSTQALIALGADERGAAPQADAGAPKEPAEAPEIKRLPAPEPPKVEASEILHDEATLERLAVRLRPTAPVDSGAGERRGFDLRDLWSRGKRAIVEDAAIAARRASAAAPGAGASDLLRRR